MLLNIEQEAREAVEGNRGQTYGPPSVNHTRTAIMFSSYLYAKYGIEIDLDAVDVCEFNGLQKMSRAMHKSHRDAYVDRIGYIINLDLMEKE